MKQRCWKAVSLYTNALMLLDQYDHQSLKSLLEARLSIELHMKIKRNMGECNEDSFTRMSWD